MKEKLAKILSKGESFFDIVLNFIGKHPWDRWMKSLNGHLDIYIPLFIAISGATALLVQTIMLIRYGMPIGAYNSLLAIVGVTIFSIYIAPKALALARTPIEKGRKEVIRPEVLYLLRLLLGMGGLVATVCMTLSFDIAAIVGAHIVFLLSSILIVVTMNPAVIGYEEGNPTNCLEEAIGLVLFFVKTLLFLLTPILTICCIGGFFAGIGAICDGSPFAGCVFLSSAGIVTIVPFVVYIAYVVYFWFIDLVCGLASIPSKLDKIHQALTGVQSAGSETIEVECPSCHQVSLAPADIADGQHIICSSCATKFTYTK